MNKLIRYVQNYLIIGFLFVMVYMVGGGYTTNMPFVFQALCLNMMVWLVTLAIFALSLIFFAGMRERTIRRLANIKERDEREVYITGQASRSAYMSTLALMLCCLFFSLVNVNYSRVNSQDNNGPKHSIGVGVNYTFLRSEADTRTAEEKANTIFDTRDYAPSAASLIMFFIIWQLGMFRFYLKKSE